MSTAETVLEDYVRSEGGEPISYTDVEEVLQELRTLRFAKENRAEYGLSPITIHNDLTLPHRFQLTRHSEVRFKTGPALNDYLEMTMPTTRDHGWVQISTGDFSAKPTVQLRGGMLMLRAVREP